MSFQKFGIRVIIGLICYFHSNQGVFFGSETLGVRDLKMIMRMRGEDQNEIRQEENRVL